MADRWNVHELEELLVLYCERVHRGSSRDHRVFARAVAPEIHDSPGLPAQ